LQKVVKKLSKKLSKSCQKLSKSCQKSCQKVVKKLSKKLSKSCKKVAKTVSQCDTGHGCHTCNICHIRTKYHCHVSLVTKCVIGDYLQLTFKVVGREGGSKSAFEAFGRQLCCRPKAKTVNKSRATRLLIGRWKNSEENTKTLKNFFIFFTVFSINQSEAELQIVSHNSHHGVIIVAFEAITEIEMHLHGWPHSKSN
jgi:hypothetical protein